MTPVGDSTWEVKAAAAAEVPTLALLTGGFSEAELREVGAVEVAKSIATLREGGIGQILDLAPLSAFALCHAIRG